MDKGGFEQKVNVAIRTCVLVGWTVCAAADHVFAIPVPEPEPSWDDDDVIEGVRWEYRIYDPLKEDCPCEILVCKKS